jgi:hypothetical protein
MSACGTAADLWRMVEAFNSRAAHRQGRGCAITMRAANATQGFETAFIDRRASRAHIEERANDRLAQPTKKPPSPQTVKPYILASGEGGPQIALR